MEMFGEIVSMAVEIQFSLGKVGKNVKVIYPMHHAAFDPALMQDANDRSAAQEDDDTRASDADTASTTAPVVPPRVVAHCIGFGCQGSGGIAQKSLVVLALASAPEQADILSATETA
jgi:hypothetical protein